MAVFYIDRWLADPKEKALLIEMYKAIHGFADSAWGAPSILKAKIEAAFESRELVMLRQTHGAAGGGGSGGGKSPSDRARAQAQQRAEQARRAERQAAGGGSQASIAKKPVKTWIAFQLVDEDGEPVAGEKYRIQITDGSVREGRLDSEGQVRIVNLDPGSCVISFPDLDSTEWRPL